MKPAKIKLVHEPEPVELLAVARVGEFVARVARRPALPADARCEVPVNVGCGNLRANSDGVIAEAKKRAKEPTNACPIDLASDREVIAWLLAVRDAEKPAFLAARLVYEAFKTDDDVIAQIDAAFRLGGAEAVRDLVLRGLSAPKG